MSNYKDHENGFWRKPVGVDDIGRLGRFVDREGDDFNYGMYVGMEDGEGFRGMSVRFFQCLHESPEDIEGFLHCEVFVETMGNDFFGEVKCVLNELDSLASVWGDEGVFRRCRDRLRDALAKASGESQ